MEDGLERVYASGDPVDGELLKGRLEAEGIPTMLKGEGEGPYRSGPVYLWVRSEDEVTARAVIDAVRSGAFELPSEDRDTAASPGDMPG